MHIFKLLRVFLAAFLPLVALPLFAQDDEFNPDNPADPNQSYVLTITVDPEGAAFTVGAGRYVAGSPVTVSASARNTSTTTYKFVCWKLNGQSVSTDNTYTFTMPSSNVSLVAHFEEAEPEDFNPSNPSDPNGGINRHYLYLKTNQEGHCSFNIASGLRYYADATIELKAIYNSANYKFLGWYKNGTLFNESDTFKFIMPEEDITLTANLEEIVFNPANPEDPNSVVLQMGDVDGDGTINTTDAVVVINYYLGHPVSNFHEKQADMNGDGYINTADAVAIINKYLNK